MQIQINAANRISIYLWFFHFYTYTTTVSKKKTQMIQFVNKKILLKLKSAKKFNKKKRLKTVLTVAGNKSDEHIGEKLTVGKHRYLSV